jgi:GNAT superfamily N-acetyltransferase
VKGQLLYVREAEEEEIEPRLRAAVEGGARWFAAKLVGDLVAVAAASSSDERPVTLLALEVRPDYRGKRIGSRFLTELERLLAHSGARRLALRKGIVSDSFAARAGYARVDERFEKALEE